jgi:hypothetical protein
METQQEMQKITEMLIEIFSFTPLLIYFLLKKISKKKPESKIAEFVEKLEYWLEMLGMLGKILCELIEFLLEVILFFGLWFAMFFIGVAFYAVTWNTENVINNSAVDGFGRFLILNYKFEFQLFLGIVFLLLYGIFSIIIKLDRILKLAQE